MPSSRTPAGETPADPLSAGRSPFGDHPSTAPGVSRRGRSADSDPHACEELARAFDAGLIVAGSPEAQAVVTGRWWRGRDGRPGVSSGLLGEAAVLSSGFPALDRLLPAGGVRPGRLIELLLADACSGGITLACAVAMRVAAAGGARGSNGRGLLVVVDRFGDFHPPSVFGWSDWQRCQLVVARPSRDEDEVWAIDQALRCPGVGAVVSWPRRVHPTSMRRWQLAARNRSGEARSGEAASVGPPVADLSIATHGLRRSPPAVPRDRLAEGGVVGLIVRPAADICRPSWAEVRLLVESRPSGGPLKKDRGSTRGPSPPGGGGIHSIAWRITRLEGPVDSGRQTVDVAMNLATGASVPVEGCEASQESACLAGSTCLAGSNWRSSFMPGKSLGGLFPGPARSGEGSPEACA
jgi:hypothetical protein